MVWPAIIAAVAGLAAKGVDAQKASMTAPGVDSSPFFGPLLNNVDHSNWAVNFGDSGTASVTAGPKTGPTQTYIPTQQNPDTQTAYSIPPNSGGIGAPAPSAGGIPGVQSGGSVGGIPTVYLMMAGGAVLLLVLWKKR